MDSVSALLYLSLAWIAYLSLHSVLISITVTDYLKRALGDGYRWYHLIFVLVSIGTLVPVSWYSARVKGDLFFSWEGNLHYLKWFLRALGISLFLAGFQRYSVLSFLGIRQILDGKTHQLMNENGRLSADGILGLVRHPFYTGTIILFWARELDYSRLVINIIVTVYVVIGTLLEERKLLREFGDHYREYQRRVSMFIPWKWIRTRLWPRKESV